MEDDDMMIMNTGSKKQRLNDQTFTALSTNSVSELRATIVALQDRARITSDAVLGLQRKNEQQAETIKSQHIL